MWAGNEGFLDPIPTAQVPRFQQELREHLRTEASIYAAIRDERLVSDETETKLRAELDRFANTFSVHEEALVA